MSPAANKQLHDEAVAEAAKQQAEREAYYKAQEEEEAQAQQEEAAAALDQVVGREQEESERCVFAGVRLRGAQKPAKPSVRPLSAATCSAVS